MATLTAVGHATVSVPPDEASLALGVESTRATPQEALDDVAARAATLVALCDELGVAPGRRTTSGVSVAEVGEHDREGRYQHRGCQASESLTALASGLGVRVGALVEAVDGGASPPQPRGGGMRMLAVAADTVPVEAGEQQVSASVTVTYQVEQP